MAPRRSASGRRRRGPRVRECALDKRGRRQEERRLTREMEALLQRGRQLGNTAFTRVLWQAINYGVENGVLQLYTGARPNQLPVQPAAEGGQPPTSRTRSSSGRTPHPSAAAAAAGSSHDRPSARAALRRGAASPASVGCLRRLVSFVLLPLQLLCGGRGRGGTSGGVRIRELPADAAS